MTCRPIVTKLLSSQMVTYHQSHPKEQNLVENYRNQEIFIDEITLAVIICNSAISPGGEMKYNWFQQLWCDIRNL